MSGSPEAQMLGNAQSAKAITGTESQKNKIPYGCCSCGCGMKTRIADKTVKKNGAVKGKPLRFIIYHHLGKRENGPAWKGGTTNTLGRKQIMIPGHHRADHCGYVLNSILVAENATGLKIKKPAEIHHVNCDVSNDSNKNLVICQDRAYHFFIEIRSKAFLECGHARWRKCVFCKEYDDLKNLTMSKRKGRADGMYYHKICASEYKKKRYRMNKLVGKH